MFTFDLDTAIYFRRYGKSSVKNASMKIRNLVNKKTSPSNNFPYFLRELEQKVLHVTRSIIPSFPMKKGLVGSFCAYYTATGYSCFFFLRQSQSQMA